MSFSVLPAIDLSEGRLGVVTPEGPRGVEAFGGDAVAAAVAFRAMGATWVHVVDMDLAFTGVATGASVIAAIAALPDVRVQASGGVRTVAHLDAMREAGASRVVVSSAALDDEEALRELLASRGSEELVIGIEVAAGRIRSRGIAAVDLDLAATLAWLDRARPPAFLVTATDRVATARGPDLASVRLVADTGVPTMAAGGITSIGDLRAVREAGAIGAIVGRAALDGSIDLAAALAWGRA